MKKFITWMILLIALAGAGFLAGWIQFRIPAGSYGVYVTKTRGWHSGILEPGRFAWTWEALIPTNLRLFRFTVEPRTEAVTFAGSLPSSGLYAGFAVGNPGFLLRRILHDCRLGPPGGPSRRRGIPENRNPGVPGRVADRGSGPRGKPSEDCLLARSSDPDWIAAVLGGDPGAMKALSEDIAEGAPELEILSVAIRSLKVPDLDLYGAVRSRYLSFLESEESALNRILEKESQARAQVELRLESLERYGQLITKYPKLIDFLAVENRTDAALLEALGKRGRVAGWNTSSTSTSWAI
ncbi:MAG: hypothetical protein MZU97_07900 [Bacillus subtilis]|nr:hypothetical protein [Bacillus subtilis]